MIGFSLPNYVLFVYYFRTSFFSHVILPSKSFLAGSDVLVLRGGGGGGGGARFGLMLWPEAIVRDYKSIDEHPAQYLQVPAPNERGIFNWGVHKARRARFLEIMLTSQGRSANAAEMIE
jgi:hypothetical protein